MRLINGVFFAPYFIFIRDRGQLTNADLLRRLHLQHYQAHTTAEDATNTLCLRHLYLCKRPEWTHLMDDWLYTLWHDRILKEHLARLSEDFDIFTISIGDSDNSYEFVYWKKGVLRRHFFLGYPNYRDAEILKDIGEPLASEKRLPAIFNHDTHLTKLADLMEIKLIDSLDGVEAYACEEAIAKSRFQLGEQGY